MIILHNFGYNKERYYFKERFNFFNFKAVSFQRKNAMLCAYHLKTPMEECYFFTIFKIVQIVPDFAKRLNCSGEGSFFPIVL